MSMVEVKIPKLEALQQAFRDYPRISEPILQRAIMGTAAILAKNRTRRTVPFRTGRLLQSFFPSFSRLQMAYSPNVFYAQFVHDGTRAYTIYPATKKALFWAGAAHPVKKVNHPATKGRPFMKEIVEAAQPEITDYFVRALDEVNRSVANRFRE